ncbi:MAG: HI0074 family nucleotidyltransferase substrate-binding subunit [Candidatus Ornithomonoglobus sp.]
MKKLDNFLKCLGVLKKADRESANENEIYRTGIIGQFNLTFELAWKALQEVLRLHSVTGSESGSPREILKLGYRVNFINDAGTWLDMLNKRNLSVHIYDEDEISEMLDFIFDKYIPAFEELAEILKTKIDESADNWI